jgi:hypothetical protein
MELEGHPTHDIVEELERRGALMIRGSSNGPEAETVETLRREAPGLRGNWLFLPDEVYATGMDEYPD